jgi:hypothetical protein
MPASFWRHLHSVCATPPGRLGHKRKGALRYLERSDSFSAFVAHLCFSICGLGFVIISGIAWTFLCWRDHVQATDKSGLLHSAAYAKHSEYIIYDQFKAGDVLNRHIHTRSPFSWPYLVGFLVIAPFGTFFYRFFGDQIGHHGMVWVLGFLTYPLYLVFISAIVQGYRQNFLIPKLLTQQTGKPVFWAG